MTSVSVYIASIVTNVVESSYFESGARTLPLHPSQTPSRHLHVTTDSLMAQLVLLVVAAAWAAVLIPPMLRSRVENHPNSSVTDFRRQLNTLQSTSTPARGSLRAMGRPLTQSPLQRPAAAGRPGQHLHRQAAVHAGAGRTAGGPRVECLVPRHTATRRVDRTGRTPERPAPPDPHGPPARSARRHQAAPQQRVVRARRRRGLQHVPRRHHRVDGAALRVRAGVPRPVRIRVPAGATPPT